MERLNAVRNFRLKSNRQATQELAATPGRFAFISHEEKGYLLVPSVSSERRYYIPIGFMPAEVIASNLCLVIPHATLYHFGVLSSTMHMAWVRAVCGRLESRYRYSAGIVYNNFPWPEPTDSQRQAIETAAQAVLGIRTQYLMPLPFGRGVAVEGVTLADLYDPLAMPPELLQAHRRLDRAVDAAYGKTAFATEAERVAFLFERYRQLTSLLPEEGPKRRTGRRK